MIRHGLRLLVVYALLFCVFSKKQYYDIYNVMPALIKGLQGELTDYNAQPLFRTDNITRKNSANKQKETPIVSKEREAQLKKVRNVIEFIRKYPVTLKFFYDEMQRIKTQKEVIDSLRRMITLLEWIPQMKNDVLARFRKLSKKVQRVEEFWKEDFNDLKINPYPSSFRDPSVI